jgi:hypothetical protein
LSAEVGILRARDDERKEEQRHHLSVGAGNRSRSPSPAAVAPVRLLGILNLSMAQKTGIHDPKVLLTHATDDLLFIASNQQFSVHLQGQAQSVLQEPQFVDWLHNTSSELLLVDGNMSSAATDSISALSLFCTTFVVNIRKGFPQDITLSFFCGRHNDQQDPWFGPNGLVRSLIAQLLMALPDHGVHGLRLGNPSRFLKEFKNHNLNVLCETLLHLLQHVPQGKSVYFIIDGVSCFDRDWCGLFQDMKVVLDWLYTMIEDKNMMATLKVLLTSPGISTKRFAGPEGLVLPSEKITLSTMHLQARTISDRSIQESISRPSTPVRRPDWNDGASYSR